LTSVHQSLGGEGKSVEHRGSGGNIGRSAEGKKSTSKMGLGAGRRNVAKSPKKKNPKKKKTNPTTKKKRTKKTNLNTKIR